MMIFQGMLLAKLEGSTFSTPASPAAIPVLVPVSGSPGPPYATSAVPRQLLQTGCDSQRAVPCA